MPHTTDANATLDRIIATLGELPASPTIVSAVMGLTSNLDSKITDVSKVLASDQSLTAKVLKLSNSSFFGRSKEVCSLHEAVMVLGFFTVRSMVIATSAQTMYNKGSADGPRAKLWRHSLSTAVTTRQIAAEVRHPEKEELFIAALLHDIGKLVLMEKLSPRYDELVSTIESKGDSFFEAENRELGFDHCDVSQILLEKWSFPAQLSESIYRHHELPPIEDPESPVPMEYVISLGNDLSKRMGVGFGDRCPELLAESPAAMALGLDEERLTEILEQAQKHYTDEVRILEGK